MSEILKGALPRKSWAEHLLIAEVTFTELGRDFTSLEKAESS